MKILYPSLATLLLFFAQLMLVNAQPEIRVQLGHSDFITLATISSDGKYALSYSYYGEVILWDVLTGKELRRIEGQKGIPSSLAFSPDGKSFLTGFMSGSLILWELSSGKALKEFKGHEDNVRALAFSNCGKFVVSGSGDNSVKLWDISTGNEVRKYLGNSTSVYSIAISANGKLIASGAKDKTVKIWDLASGKEVKSFDDHTETVIAVSFTPDGKNLLVGSKNEFKLWDISTGKEIKNITMAKFNNPMSIAFSIDGKFAMAGFTDKTMRLYDIALAKEIRRFPNHSSWVYSVAFSSDGNYGLVGAGKELKLWDLKLGQEIQCLKGYSNFVYSVVFSPNDKFILSGTSGRLCEWELSTGRLTRSFKGSDVILKDIASTPNGSALYSSDGKNAIAAYNSKSFKIWNIAQGAEIRNFKVNSDYTYLLSLTQSADGKYALTGSSDYMMRLWDLSTGDEIRSFKASSDYIYSTAFSSDGKQALSGSANGKVQLWSIDGKELHTFTGHTHFVTSVSFSPNGKLAISGSLDGTIKIWDLTSKQELRTLTGHSRGITSVAISPDGKFILSGSADKNLKIWDATTGKELFTLTGHINMVRSVAFSHNSLYAISGSDDGTMRVWDVKSGKHIYTTISNPEGEYLAWTPDGYFEGSQELAKKAVYIVNGMGIINIDQLFEQFYQPGIIAARMENKSEIPQGGNLAQIKLPPLVRIISPSNLANHNEEQLSVTVQATDMGSGIDEIRLYLNGKHLEGTQRGFFPISKFGATQSKTFIVPLVDGENKIRAITFSNQRTESLPHEITVNHKATKLVKPNMYILAIGINNYQNPRYNLNYAVNDANAFVKTLKEGAKEIFGSITTHTIFDANAKREGIMAAIDKIKSQAEPEDVFVFYYAGHGVMSSGSANERPEFYLVPHDITKMYEADDILKKLGISAREIADFSKNIRSQKQLFLLDACQSGGALQSFAMRGAAEEKAIAQLSRSTGTFFIAASGSEQFATEVATLGHGIFTYSVVESLKGACKSQDGRLTVNLLKGCIETLVPELSNKYKGILQYPTGYGFGQDFPIVIVK